MEKGIIAGVKGTGQGTDSSVSQWWLWTGAWAVHVTTGGEDVGADASRSAGVRGEAVDGLL